MEKGVFIQRFFHGSPPQLQVRHRGFGDLTFVRLSPWKIHFTAAAVVFGSNTPCTIPTAFVPALSLIGTCWPPRIVFVASLPTANVVVIVALPNTGDDPFTS